MKKNRELNIEPIKKNPRKIGENDSAVVLGVTSIRNSEDNKKEIEILSTEETVQVSKTNKKPTVIRTQTKKRKKYEPTKIHDLKLSDTIAIVMNKMNFKTKQQAYTYSIQRVAEIFTS